MSDVDKTASRTVDGAGIQPGVLAKVRALLAKAESTTFAPEAEALTAKAHQLVARYSIDTALMEDGHTTDGVLARPVAVDAPYARAKFHLLGQVARACRCRVLWQVDLGIATVFGFAGDLDATELLYTSLLLQATTAVMLERSPRGAPANVAAFRRAFLYAFANRIGQRLRASAAQVVAEASQDHSGSLLPVLTSREAAVEAALAEAFPNTRAVRFSVSDARGWRAGVDAAERASLSTQPPLSGRGALGRAG